MFVVPSPTGHGDLIISASKPVSAPSSSHFAGLHVTYDCYEGGCGSKDEHAQLHVLREVPGKEGDAGACDQTFLHDPIRKTLPLKVLSTAVMSA